MMLVKSELRPEHVEDYDKKRTRRELEILMAVAAGKVYGMFKPSDTPEGMAARVNQAVKDQGDAILKAIRDGPDIDKN